MNRIKILRENATPKMSQAKLAQLVGVGRTTVTMWESGTNEPSFEVVLKLSKIFNVSTDYILGADKKEPTPIDGSGLSEKDIRLASWFQSLPPEMRKAILTLGGGPEELAE